MSFAVLNSGFVLKINNKWLKNVLLVPKVGSKFEVFNDFNYFYHYQDTELTWNTTDPYFTSCFEESVLSSVPVVFLLLFCLVDVNNIFAAKKVKKRDFKPEFNKCIGTKSLLIFGLIVTYIVHFVRLWATLPESTVFYGTDYFSPAIHLIGYVRIRFLFFFQINQYNS